MARPERNNVDYFPLYCDEGKKMFYIEETYGNDGFAVFIKILRELAKTDFHYLNLSNNTTLMFLSAKCKVSKEILESIIKDLVELDKFDSVLWNENKIIWCQDFIDSIQDAYIKRKNKCISYQGLFTLLIGLGIRKQSKGKPKAPVNPQSKVDKSKPNKTKVNPTFDEVESYGIEKGYNLPVQKIIDHYTDGGNLDYWIDANDKKVIRWKSKISSIWFKDEYKQSKPIKREIPKEQSQRPIILDNAPLANPILPDWRTRVGGKK